MREEYMRPPTEIAIKTLLIIIFCSRYSKREGKKAEQNFSATLHKPIKIRCFKTKDVPPLICKHFSVKAAIFS